MNKISIFENKEKKIDLNKLIDSRALIFANSGAGKSYLVRKILEESHGKVMAIVLDIEGEFKTLREGYDDFLLIGEQGDVPLNIRAVQLLPKKLLELNISTIIDISELKRHDRILYVKKFLETLMELPREYWKPCLVILDEIHNLAGQQEKQESTYAVIDLATRGRKRGFCLIGATQRISKLHKDVVAELNNYMAGRTSLDIDMKRTADILGFTTKQDMLSLRNLDDGEFYVFGTAISKVIEKEKVAKSRTTHPKQGMDIKSHLVKPTETIKKILTKLSDLPKEAEVELKELNDYKRKIQELYKELAITKKNIQVKEKIVTISDNEALKKSFEKGVKETEKKYDSIIRSVELNSSALKKSIEKLMRDSSQLLQSKAFSIISDRPIVQTPEFKSIERVTSITHQSNQMKPKLQIEQKRDVILDTDISLNLCARKIYSLLLENSNRDFTKSQIAILTGYSIKSSGFINALSQLNVKNLINRMGNRFTIGVLIPELATENIGEFSKEIFINKLSKCPRDIFKFLLDNPESEFTKEEIAKQTNYSLTSSGFINSLSKLNVLELIQRNGNSIKLNPEILEI